MLRTPTPQLLAFRLEPTAESLIEAEYRALVTWTKSRLVGNLARARCCGLKFPESRFIGHLPKRWIALDSSMSAKA